MRTSTAQLDSERSSRLARPQLDEWSRNWNLQPCLKDVVKFCWSTVEDSGGRTSQSEGSAMDVCLTKQSSSERLKLIVSFSQWMNGSSIKHG